ncbi:hypothetical protein FHX58_007348 [Paraburkholderia tropica]|nr:hypothetical protein [Paraburkholderia tropica]
MSRQREAAGGQGEAARGPGSRAISGAMLTEQTTAQAR